MHPDNPNGLRYAIRKMDDLNWQVWKWQDGGKEITRGRYAGQKTQAKWCPMESYHPHPGQAAECLLRYATLDNAPEGVNLDTEAILAATKAAVEQVIAAVEAITPAEFSKKSNRGRKPKDGSEDA